MSDSPPTYWQYMSRYGLLALGVALVTFGVVAWMDTRFDLRGFWLYDNGWRPHPVHYMMVGIGIVPPTIWEVFQLEAQHFSFLRQQASATSEDSAESEQDAT